MTTEQWIHPGKWAAALDPIEHLDFDVPCDHEGCEHPAVWILWRVRCCPQIPGVVLACEDCRARVWRQVIGWCINCKQRFVPARACFYRVELINERRRGGS